MPCQAPEGNEASDNPSIQLIVHWTSASGTTSVQVKRVDASALGAPAGVDRARAPRPGDGHALRAGAWQRPGGKPVALAALAALGGLRAMFLVDLISLSSSDAILENEMQSDKYEYKSANAAPDRRTVERAARAPRARAARR